MWICKECGRGVMAQQVEYRHVLDKDGEFSNIRLRLPEEAFHCSYCGATYDVKDKTIKDIADWTKN